MRYTDTLNLHLPEANNYAEVEELNGNFRVLDTEAKAARDAAQSATIHAQSVGNPHKVKAEQVYFRDGAPLPNKASVADTLKDLAELRRTGMNYSGPMIGISQLADYLAGLPRILTSNITVTVTPEYGITAPEIELKQFTGPGSLEIKGQAHPGQHTLPKIMSLKVAGCFTPTSIVNIDVEDTSQTVRGVVNIFDSPTVKIIGCTIKGGENSSGVAALNSRVDVDGCSITDCAQAAVRCVGPSLVSVHNQASGQEWARNGRGAWTWDGGIVTISGQTPEDLGGPRHDCRGGTVIGKKGNILV